MKILVNNLLVLIIFLSPMVNGFEINSCHAKMVTKSVSKSTSETNKVTCHEQQHQVNGIICSDYCCEKCHCNALVIAIVIKEIKNDVHTHLFHSEYKFSYLSNIPFQALHPLLRPPIV